MRPHGLPYLYDKIDPISVTGLSDQTLFIESENLRKCVCVVGFNRYYAAVNDEKIDHAAYRVHLQVLGGEDVNPSIIMERNTRT